MGFPRGSGVYRRHGSDRKDKYPQRCIFNSVCESASKQQTLSGLKLHVGHGGKWKLTLAKECGKEEWNSFEDQLSAEHPECILQRFSSTLKMVEDPELVKVKAVLRNGTTEGQEKKGQAPNAKAFLTWNELVVLQTGPHPRDERQGTESGMSQSRVVF